MSDPGLPSRLAERIARESSGSDGNHGLQGDKYRLQQCERLTPLLDDGTLDLEEMMSWSSGRRGELLVVVTEIPRKLGGRAVMAEIHYSEGLVIVSLPALGSWNLFKLLSQAIYESLEVLTDPDLDDSDEPDVTFGRVRPLETSQPTQRAYYIISSWWRPGHLRLVVGMIRTNEPLRAVTKLSGVLAAATATGAFGVFYSSIWQMAEFLPGWRLGLITLIAISSMVIWLIASNGLWERSKKVNSVSEAAIYNSATVLTLFFAVALLYLALFIGIFLMAVGVIQTDFMATKLVNDVSLGNYIDIAWLSASMGTVAGALGSNFDDEEIIRTVIHGSRRMERFYRNRREEERAKEARRSEA